MVSVDPSVPGARYKSISGTTISAVCDLSTRRFQSSKVRTSSSKCVAAPSSALEAAGLT